MSVAVMVKPGKDELAVYWNYASGPVHSLTEQEEERLWPVIAMLEPDRIVGPYLIYKLTDAEWSALALPMPVLPT